MESRRSRTDRQHQRRRRGGRQCYRDQVWPLPRSRVALDIEPLAPGEPAALRELWSLLPETVDVPLTDDVMWPVLLFFQDGWPRNDSFAQAELTWIPRRLRDLYGRDRERIKEHLDRYPALRDSTLQVSQPVGGVNWGDGGPGLRLAVEWRSGSPVALLDNKTFGDVGVACYRAADDSVVTPAIGSMRTGLHPFLALWAVLLTLSSLARYEPAIWSKMIDIDRSAEANAIEHLLDATIGSVPATVLHLLTTFPRD